MVLPAQLQGAFLPTFGLFPQVATPTYDLDLAGLIARNEAAKKVTTEKFNKKEI